jgi:hypothetical protein
MYDLHLFVNVPFVDSFFVYCNNAHFNITLCLFSNTFAYVLKSPFFFACPNFQTDCAIFENFVFENIFTSSNNSLFVFTFAQKIPFFMKNCSFSNVYSAYAGLLSYGAIFSFTCYSSDANFTLEENIFNNISLSSSGGNGAVLFFSCSEVNIFSLKNCNFINIISNSNGTLFIGSTSNSLHQFSSKFIIDHCAFKNCCSLYGGALYFVNVYLFLFIYLLQLLMFV